MFLHQTWKSHDVPVQFHAYQDSWLRHHPWLTRRIWDDAECRAFVADVEPSLLATYDAFPAHIMRVDTVRYVWMRHLGGIYADLDVECLRSLYYLHGRGAHVVKEKMGPKDDTIGNAVMASTPGDPFWEHVLAMVKDRARRMLHSYARLPFPEQCHMVLKVTGPYMLTDALATYPGHVNVHEEAEAGVKHHGAGTWWRGGVVV